MKCKQPKIQFTGTKFQSKAFGVGIGICLLLFGISSCNNDKKTTADTGTTAAPTGAQLYTDTGASSVQVFDDKGRVCIQQTSTYYEMTEAYQGTTKIPVLLKIRRTDLCYADSTNRDKVFEISARNVMGGGKPVQWEAKFVATTLQFTDNTLLAIHEGSVTEEDLSTRYNLLDGKEVFSACYELKVQIPNTRDRRFMGYTSRRTVTEPLKAYNEENLLAVVKYASDAKLISTLKFKLKRSKIATAIPLSTPDMIFVAQNENTKAIESDKKIILMKADEHYTSADVKDFVVKFTFFYGDDNETTEVVIPISNDNFDLAKAKYDKEVFEIVSE